MTDTRDAARRRLRKIATDRAKATDVEAAAILAALRLGVRQVDVARDVERSREHIRRVARLGGIEPEQPGTGPGSQLP